MQIHSGAHIQVLTFMQVAPNAAYNLHHTRVQAAQTRSFYLNANPILPYVEHRQLSDRGTSLFPETTEGQSLVFQVRLTLLYCQSNVAQKRKEKKILIPYNSSCLHEFREIGRTINSLNCVGRLALSNNLAYIIRNGQMLFSFSPLPDVSNHLFSLCFFYRV